MSHPLDLYSDPDVREACRGILEYLRHLEVTRPSGRYAYGTMRASAILAVAAEWHRERFLDLMAQLYDVAQAGHTDMLAAEAMQKAGAK